VKDLLQVFTQYCRTSIFTLLTDLSNHSVVWFIGLSIRTHICWFLKVQPERFVQVTYSFYKRFVWPGGCPGKWIESIWISVVIVATSQGGEVDALLYRLRLSWGRRRIRFAGYGIEEMRLTLSERGERPSEEHQRLNVSMTRVSRILLLLRYKNPHLLIIRLREHSLVDQNTQSHVT